MTLDPKPASPPNAGQPNGSQSQAASPPVGLPLFYKQPEALIATVHGDLHLTSQRDMHFAAHTNAVPIMLPEFIEAQQDYPIVFAGDPVHPAAVLGLEQDNPFIESSGDWAADYYIPAYVRRYPFLVIDSADQSQYALGVDVASTRVVKGPPGQPLFEAGQPTQLTLEAMRVCGMLHSSLAITRRFCEALVERNLLIEQAARGTMAGGKPFNFQGFRIVDAQKLETLPDATVLEWHRNGWLAAIHHHLASLNRWRKLLARQAATRSPPAAT
jgi:hypothetical protein